MKKIQLILVTLFIFYRAAAQPYLPLSGGTLSGPLFIGDNYFAQQQAGTNIFAAGSSAVVLGTGSGTDHINYTYGNNPYSIWTNNINRLLIDGTGRVGISTTLPQATLDVAGHMGSVDNRNFRVTYPDGGGLANTELSGLTHLQSELGLNAWTALYAKAGVAAYAGAFNGTTFFTNGNVGIGTSTPSDLLTLNAGFARKGLTIASNGDGTTYTDIALTIANSGAVPTGAPLGWLISHRSDGFFSGTPAGSSSLEFYSYLQGGGYYAPLSFKPDGNVVMVSALRARGGNVLIGKTTQTNTSYKLDVNGSVRANEIVVNTTGADFVFNKKYQLPELKEVKKYIEKEHHLPDIASAKQMSENGMAVGDLNAKLLQKIEELTLYVIDQQKQINQLKAKLDQKKKDKSALL